MSSTATVPPTRSPTDAGRRAASAIRTALKSYGILFALGLLILVIQLQSGGFLTSENLFNLGGQWAAIGTMAAGETMVLIAGGFDLSVGTTYSFSATLAAYQLQHHQSIGVVILLVLALGAAIGLINGLLVTKANINPFVATLGTSQAFLGLALVYSNGGTFNTSNNLIITLGSGRVGEVPVSLIVMGVVMVVLGGVLAWTVYGRLIYAVGGNFDASFLSGVRADAIRISTYMISGIMAATAGLMFLGRVGSAQASSTGIEFNVLAAVLIGGISIAGGEGAMWRAFVGLALLASLQNFFFRTGVNDFWQQVVQGAVILLAVGLDAYPKRAHRRPLSATLGGWRARSRDARRARSGP
jgi:ribose/xylose/arabinose/galactoside ABC-type transport system permease subunit